METTALVETYIATGQKIDVLWNFFVTVHVAIAGFLLLDKKRTVHFAVACCLSVGYLVFSYINYTAKKIEYQLLMATTQQLRSSTDLHEYLKGFFETVFFDDRHMINLGIHVFAAFTIVIVFKFSDWTVRSKNTAVS